MRERGRVFVFLSAVPLSVFNGVNLWLRGALARKKRDGAASEREIVKSFTNNLR